MKYRWKYTVGISWRSFSYLCYFHQSKWESFFLAYISFLPSCSCYGFHEPREYYQQCFLKTGFVSLFLLTQFLCSCVIYGPLSFSTRTICFFLKYARKGWWWEFRSVACIWHDFISLWSWNVIFWVYNSSWKLILQNHFKYYFNVFQFLLQVVVKDQLPFWVFFLCR